MNFKVIVLLTEYCDSESDWLYFDGYCYFIKKFDSKNFKEASKLCYEKKSSLLSIHSRHESNWLLEQVRFMFNTVLYIYLYNTNMFIIV